jgi:putative flippase GtrA
MPEIDFQPVFNREIYPLPVEDSYKKKARYLIAGSFNTISGYTISIGLYLLMQPYLHIVLIGIVTNIITVTLSFLTYKYFVFKTNGNWTKEYIRSYSVYGVSIILGIFLIWILVDFVKVSFWIAQGVVLFMTALFSYFGHKNYTFTGNK